MLSLAVGCHLGAWLLGKERHKVLSLVFVGDVMAMVPIRR